MPQTVNFAWKDAETAWRFSTGVSLHGHTMHSEECLSFLPRYLHQAPGISQIVSGYERGPEPVDFARAYWTPPLSPASALRVERKQIENMDLRPLVSLTDHDDIRAGMSLQVASDPREVPVSVEWTVPYARSIFHLGIHNLPPASARELMSRLTAFTASPNEERLPGILRELAEIRDVLIVLNHPFWLEEGIEQADHDRALPRILRECLDSVHAFELNGTRVWKENKKAIELAREYGKPLISGGDRHACEPSACINLTNASSFSEFVSEVRNGYSVPYFMAHYREPMTLRILEAAWDILRPYPAYPGRERWTDRIFYRGSDGIALPLSQVWRDRTPWVMTAPFNAAAGFLQLVTAPGLRATMRHFLAERGEILP
jgi:predicted metal-dependent phosphoesterase TrpH